MMTPISSNNTTRTRAASPSHPHHVHHAHRTGYSFMPRGMVCRMMFALAALVCVQVIPQTRLSYRKMLRAESDLNRSLLMQQQQQQHSNDNDNKRSHQMRSTHTLQEPGQEQQKSLVEDDRQETQNKDDNTPVTATATSVQADELPLPDADVAAAAAQQQAEPESPTSAEHDDKDLTASKQIQSGDENESTVATAPTDTDESPEIEQQEQQSGQTGDDPARQDATDDQETTAVEAGQSSNPGNVAENENAEPATESEEQQPAAQSANEQQHTVEKKPRFVLHMGPMKTATSSLQRELWWLIQPSLEEDGWHFIGGDDPMEHVPMDDPNVFLEQFEKEAKELRKQNKNFIRSREELSELFVNNQWMYPRLKEILKDWDVLIVAGYRPYFEWLPSFHYQGQRMKYSDPNHPEERELNLWTHKRRGKFTLVEPMFPDYFDFWKKTPRFTDSIVTPASEHFPVKVFDMHDPRGQRSAFLCDMVGEEDVPTACAESLRLQRENPSNKANASNTKEVQYDAIALKAAEKGMVNMKKWKRSEVIDAILHRQEEELQRTVLDFPLSCPTQEYIDEFWTMSRDLDVLCLPEKSREDPEHLNKLHDQFQRAVDKKKYCIVDADAILEESEWKDFFQQFA